MKYGEMNEHNVGIIMRDLTRRMMGYIDSKRFDFEAKQKIGYTGNLDDWFTDVDTGAQKEFIRLLKENFPGYGIIAEEDDFFLECTIPGKSLYFTIDPLDGTKAFRRKQSHGFGTMIALIDGEEVIAACIGDVPTGEMYYFRPKSDNVHHMTRRNQPQGFNGPDAGKPLSDRYALIREHPEVYHPLVQRILKPHGKGLVKGFQTADGSIGVSMARLWKDEVAMAILVKGTQTPWDWAPVLGISKKLGFKFFHTADDGTGFTAILPYEPKIHLKTTSTDYDIIVMHPRYEAEMINFLLKTLTLRAPK